MHSDTQTFRTDDLRPLNWTLIVGGLTLLAIIVRLPFLNLPVRCDEASVFLRYSGGGSGTLLDFLSRYSTPGRHGFHGLAVALMSLLTGAGFPWMRFPAFVAGVLSVPLTFAAMRLWIGRAPAAVAALLMAVSHWCVVFSVNARGYTMGICLVLITVWYLAKADTRRPGWYPIVAGMAERLANQQRLVQRFGDSNWPQQIQRRGRRLRDFRRQRLGFARTGNQIRLIDEECYGTVP